MFKIGERVLIDIKFKSQRSDKHDDLTLLEIQSLLKIVG